MAAFIECAGGDDPSKPVPSRVFINSLLDYEVGDDLLRAVFNGFHSKCPNFKTGEDDCPDCIAANGFQ